MEKVKKESLDSYYNQTGLRKRFYVSGQRNPRVLAYDEVLDKAKFSEEDKKAIKSIEIGQVMHFEKINVMRYWDEGRGKIGIFSQKVPRYEEQMKKSIKEMKLPI